MRKPSPSKPRSWVVTGGSRGFGRAVAEYAAAKGDRVAILARNGNVEAVAREIGDTVVGIQGDITKPDELRAAMDRLAGDWGHIDVLVNNAGLHRGGFIEEIAEDDWQAVLTTNLSGPFGMIRATLPHMGAGGSIVNVGAVVGFKGFPGDSAYGASKAGLYGLTQVLAVELARRQIRVNLVVPGFVSTEMTAGIDEKARKKLHQRIPMRREGSPEEIAEVVWWVAGSTYMTGAIIPTDGGLSCAL